MRSSSLFKFHVGEGPLGNILSYIQGPDLKRLLMLNTSLRNNKDFVLAAVIWIEWALKYASGTLKGDRYVVLAAVEQNGLALEHASDTLKDDKDVVLAAVIRIEWAMPSRNRCSNSVQIILEAFGSFETERGLSINITSRPYSPL